MSHGTSPFVQQYHEYIYIFCVSVSCMIFKEGILLHGWAFLENSVCYLDTSFPQLQELCDPLTEKNIGTCTGNRFWCLPKLSYVLDAVTCRDRTSTRPETLLQCVGLTPAPGE